MTPKLIDTPGRLAALACFGNVLAAGGFFGVSKSHDLPGVILARAALILVGFVLVYWMPYQLREGVRNQRWPAEQIGPVRRIVEHTAWQAMIFILLIAMLFAFVLDRHHHRSHYWMVLLLLQTMTQLSGAFRGPHQRPGSVTRADWTEARPLHSNHWGER